MLMPNRGNTKSTVPANTTPSNKTGSRLGLPGRASASTTSPSMTSSSFFLKKIFETNNPIAMPKAAKISNRIIIKLPVVDYIAARSHH